MREHPANCPPLTNESIRQHLGYIYVPLIRSARTGNRIMQLLHALHCAHLTKQLGVQLAYPLPILGTCAHELISLPPSLAGDSKHWKMRLGYFFLTTERSCPSPDTWETKAFLFNASLRPLLGRNTSFNRELASASAPSAAFNERPARIVVHVRSGDVFDRHFNIANYIVPPLEYYRAAILHMQRRYDHFDDPQLREPVLVVSDGGYNPTLPVLARMPRVLVMTNRTLEQDVAAIASAERLVWGYTTLRVMSLLKPEPYQEVWTWRFEWNARTGKCGHCPSVQSVVFEPLPPSMAVAEVLVTYCHGRYLSKWTNGPGQAALLMRLASSALLYRRRDSLSWQPLPALEADDAAGHPTQQPTCDGTTRNWEEARWRCGPKFEFSRSGGFKCNNRFGVSMWTVLTLKANLSRQAIDTIV